MALIYDYHQYLVAAIIFRNGVEEYKIRKALTLSMKSASEVSKRPSQMIGHVSPVNTGDVVSSNNLLLTIACCGTVVDERVKLAAKIYDQIWLTVIKR